MSGADIPPVARRGFVSQLVSLAVLLAAAALLVAALPEQALRLDIEHGVIGALGLIAVWRICWWATHLVRAWIYARWTYPGLAAQATASWRDGWRPQHLHVLITTYRERRETIDAMIAALCREFASTGQPATIWLGSRDASDEQAFASALRRFGQGQTIDLRIVRQTLPGKRVSIGLILRAMARDGLGANDLVAFMDSDFVLSDGAFKHALPLFANDPELHALTTDEDVEVHGPAWVASWLSLRFAQRRIAMQSHALSGRVLTLTGRFSIFRAMHIVSMEFIRLVEADTLESWLWGRYRFLSGDDKSTWYALLAKGHRMLYVPDAHGVTIEIVEGEGVGRMVENLRRWSGNMLRNGARAIALGPRRMPLFIWWCLVDQRLAMWTMLFGPLSAILLSVRHGMAVLVLYALYVLVTRSIVALVLFVYARRIDFNYIWCLYANQLVNAAVKVYMIWRLPMQRWANRGNQRSGEDGARFAMTMRRSAAAYLTVVSVAVLLIAAGLATNVFRHPPTWLLAHLF